MSRSYEYNVEIVITNDDYGKVPSEERTNALKEQLENLDCDLSWDYYHNESSVTLLSFGDISLGGGRSESDFAYEFTREIFNILKRPADVSWSWWYKDREPDDSHFFDDEDFAEMVPPLVQLAAAAGDDANEKEPG